jgi:RNA polymerase sigma factor (sigma-70 family)
MHASPGSAACQSGAGGGKREVVGSRRSQLALSPRAVATDDWQQWSAEYARCDASLMRLAVLLVGPHDAPDLVQDAVFRTVTTKRHADVTNHQAYLMRALVNAARQQHRGRSRRERRERAHTAVASRRVDLYFDADVDVRRAVARLSLRQRSVLYLLYWEDRSVDDVAAILEITPGAVSRHAARGRANLRGVLGE